MSPDVNINGNRSRLHYALVVVQFLLTAGAIIGGVWAAATWTENQSGKMGRLDYRIEQLEKGAIGSAPQEGRVGRLEWRVEQLERANQEERASRHQYEMEVKDSLNGITNRLTEMQILWAKSSLGQSSPATSSARGRGVGGR